MTTGPDKISPLPAENKRALLAQLLQKKAALSKALPPSFAQQRLWFLDQLEPNSPLYNLPLALRLTGPLDFSALKRSFEAVVARHELLRTTFGSQGGKPFQVIAARLSADLPLTDLRERPESER